uniref:Uncharacterized protein n=1 Tax=Utricularia reniformis TaxID=192314 RepID=A0A1Y0B0K2_9LAMI|nr:hypothetical protein AEK19_MT0655 [Utricularia reniformis]ART30907.1 hypothetical protein AEK19_MT0655 [Utricularia reniformis]
MNLLQIVPFFHSKLENVGKGLFNQSSRKGQYLIIGQENSHVGLLLVRV